MSVVAVVLPLVLMVSGTEPAPVTVDTPVPVWLHGAFGSGQWVPYDASMAPLEGSKSDLGTSIGTGVASAESMRATDRPTVYMGTSQGALVLDQVMADDAAAGVKNVSFVVIDDPNRDGGIMAPFRGVPIPVLNYTPKPVPVTPYAVSEIKVEYEGVTDFPNRPTSPGYLLALVNAAMGAYYYHSRSVFSDLATVPKSNITTSTNALGGVTTTYLVPTKTLPLLQPLVNMHVPAPIVNVLNGVLKPFVDSAYNRPAATTTAASVKTAAKPEASTKPAAASAVKESKPKAHSTTTKPTSKHDAHKGHKK